jgi:Fatty acid hydroxylase superfamily
VSSDTPSLAAAGSVHERRRLAILENVPGWYSPVLHLAAPTAVGVAVMVGALSRLHAVRLLELLVVPITLFGAFGFEWRVHQLVLHRRSKGLGLLYDRHELQHHVVFTYDDMAMRGRREWWLVLMPAYAVVLVALLNAPLAIGIGAFFGANAGCLYLVTSMFFFLSYEWLHLAYHLPRESRIGQNPVIGRLREHHRRHHDPRRMKRWNFNVTVPVFDWVHGRIWSPQREAADDARRAEQQRRRAAAHG